MRGIVATLRRTWLKAVRSTIECVEHRRHLTSRL